MKGGGERKQGLSNQFWRTMLHESWDVEILEFEMLRPLYGL